MYSKRFEYNSINTETGFMFNTEMCVSFSQRWTKSVALFDLIALFPRGPVSLPIKIKYDTRNCGRKSNLPLSTPHALCISVTTYCLQRAVSAHHSTRLSGVWCTLVASISTACIPLSSFHEAITFSPLPQFSVCACKVSTSSFFGTFT